MKNTHERLRAWRNDVQQALGVASHNLRLSYAAIDDAKRAFGSVTYNFPDEHMPRVEEIERLLAAQAEEIFKALSAIEQIRRDLDRLI